MMPLARLISSAFSIFLYGSSLTIGTTAPELAPLAKILTTPPDVTHSSRHPYGILVARQIECDRLALVADQL